MRCFIIRFSMQTGSTHPQHTPQKNTTLRTYALAHKVLYMKNSHYKYILFKVVHVKKLIRKIHCSLCSSHTAHCIITVININKNQNLVPNIVFTAFVCNISH